MVLTNSAGEIEELAYYLVMSEMTGDVVTNDCVHHWIIATAAGPISSGICKLCGESREFSNSLPEANIFFG